MIDLAAQHVSVIHTWAMYEAQMNNVTMLIFQIKDTVPDCFCQLSLWVKETLTREQFPSDYFMCTYVDILLIKDW